MEKFDDLVMRFGEHGVQALLEDWERVNGKRDAYPLAIEARWDRFIRETNHLVAALAPVALATAAVASAGA